ncbi:unnamed protein product [Prorocentrum cordatum]|uniref:Uncharacterized protein n=1 Tax=Prorocentrum cordatum TaxID=2364126 RepID=A0ABN9WMZ2_9DINO|nr:unnamed protein product [Polarella glacialis]
MVMSIAPRRGKLQHAAQPAGKHRRQDFATAAHPWKTSGWRRHRDRGPGGSRESSRGSTRLRQALPLASSRGEREATGLLGCRAGSQHRTVIEDAPASSGRGGEARPIFPSPAAA